MIAGWDSHVPTFYALEHPEACNLVPPDETRAIFEFTFLASARYSDACDYVMQCMYEENSLLAPGKPFWFEPLTDDTLFWISFQPRHVAEVTQGFCFPDLEAGSDEQLKRALESTTCLNKATRDWRLSRDAVAWVNSQL